ncbi:ABC transporter substrate-binding protein [Cupriavidus sp. D384]|uniref:substrate-binding periplasmic protein n=1 Tax=Cupriavidus sp. D384 TaxID=1538095 RepID=UPI0008321717|nr:transporter substrate-binding domain-containing protein [Cupriavidus sp. D384]
MARLRQYRWLAALLALAGIAASYAVTRPVAPGPWLQAVQQRGTLVVGVRQYARPAPPKAPTPPAPDNFDVAMARYVADRLGVTLQITGLPGEPGSPAWQAAQRHVDVVLAGASPTAGADAMVPVASAYAVGDGSLLVLRGSRYQRAADLRGQPVCVGQGSAYATRIAQDVHGVPKVYASSIRAATGFLAGECQALADDAPVVARLLTLQEWRFYRKLDGDLQADTHAAQIGLHAADPQSAAWFDHASRDWRRDGALQRARDQRAGDVAYEASQLQDGLVCHS